MKNNKIINIILVFCIIVSLFYGVKYFVASGEMFNLNTINTKFQKLKSIDESINSHFSRKLNIMNFDEINSKIGEFNKLLDELSSSSSVEYLIINDYDGKIANIKNVFDKKAYAIDLFNTLNSRTILSLRHINDLYFNLPDPQKYHDLYISMFNLDYKNAKELDSIELLIRQSVFDHVQENEFLTQLKTILQNYKELGNMVLNLNTPITDTIDSIQNDLEYIIKDGYFQLRYITTLMFMAFIVSLLFILYKSVYTDKNKILLQTYQSVLDKIFSSVIITDKNFIIRYVNDIFSKITGYQNKEVVGKKIDALHSHNHSDEFYANIYKTVKSGRVFEADEYISKDKEGKLIFEKIRTFPIVSSKKTIAYASVKLDQSTHRSIKSALTNKEIELADQAFIDRLTGFGNETAINQIIEAKTPGYVIYININHFTNLRFFYKTNTINQILVEFSKTIKLCIDTYHVKARIFRLQIDEFCLWYEGNNIKKDIEYIISYFENKIFRLNDEKGDQIVAPLSVTIGVSTDKDNPNTNRLYQATLAHHEARSKNNLIGYYTVSNLIEKRYHDNQIMTNTIQYALNNDKVFVECQPVFDISHRDIDDSFNVKYYEVLIRIIDEKANIRFPAEFLEVAKRTSLYIPLTKVLIEKVFTLLEKFPTTLFSMNLSGLDILDKSISDLFVEKVSKCAYSKNLCIEILESEEIDNYEYISDFISTIKKYNCKIAIDDFGSGYSNYYRILALDVDYIKIDGSIIRKITRDENSRAVVETIVDFAYKQKYDVVAEFVSNPETFEMIKKLGIKYAQGYLLGRPVLPSQIV